MWELSRANYCEINEEEAQGHKITFAGGYIYNILFISPVPTRGCMLRHTVFFIMLK